MKKINSSTYVIIVLVVAIIVLALVLRDKSRKLDTFRNNLEAISDTLHTYKDKEGRSVATIQILEEANLKNLLKLQSSDSTILFLQEAIKRAKSPTQVVVVEGETRVDTVFQTIPDTSSTYPTYTSNFNLGGWVTGTTVAKVDSTRISLAVKNKYDVVINKRGEVIVTNHNPYATTKSLRAASVTQPRPKRFGIGPSIGAQYNLTTNKISPYIGIGIHYNLIKF